jgi:outer membrane lipoprotein-sorting protein
MRKRLKIVILVLAAIAFTAAEAIAQNISSATMQVRVEVISGTQVSENQVADAFQVSEEETVYGNFAMNLPDGVDFITEANESVLMSNGADQWKMRAEMKIDRDEDGTVSVKFITRNNKTENIKGAIYRGKQIATIQYL